MLSVKLASRNLPAERARTILIIAVVLGVAVLVGINLATASANSALFLSDESVRGEETREGSEAPR